MSSIGKNIFYNMLLVFVNLLYPLISMSYISRILGVEILGEIGFAQSVINFLLLFATFGINNYGVRIIAQYKNKKDEIDKIFSELNIIKFFSSLGIFVIFILILYYKLGTKNYIFFSISLLLLANIFNLEWFFNGIENYKVVSLRNLVIKITTFIITVVIINNKKDTNLYCTILVVGQLLGNIYTFYYSKKFVSLKFKNLNFKRHYKSLQIFFISSIITSIYTIVNEIILGILSNPIEVAYFKRARQLQLIAVTIIGAINTALIPRISYSYKNDLKEYYNLLKLSLNYNYILIIPSLVIVVSLNREINLFLGGNEFLPASNLLLILSPLILIISIGIWVYSMIVIPMEIEKIGIYVYSWIAGLSIIFNLVLIPNFYSYGASFALLLSEGIGLFITFFFIKKYKNIEVKIFTKSLIKYIISGLIMLIVIEGIKYSFKENILILSLGFFLGGISYLIFLILLKEKVILEILKNIKKYM